MTIWLIIGIFVVVDGIVVMAAFYALSNMWNGFARSFPPVEPEPDAVTRRFQSFRLGLLNLGFAFHVTADTHYMHLEPSKPMRWLGGSPVSIPWDAMTLAKPVGNRRWTTVRIGRHTLHGPAWCLELADRTPSHEG